MVADHRHGRPAIIFDGTRPAGASVREMGRPMEKKLAPVDLARECRLAENPS